MSGMRELVTGADACSAGDGAGPSNAAASLADALLGRRAKQAAQLQEVGACTLSKAASSLQQGPRVPCRRRLRRLLCLSLRASTLLKSLFPLPRPPAPHHICCSCLAGWPRGRPQGCSPSGRPPQRRRPRRRCMASCRQWRACPPPQLHRQMWMPSWPGCPREEQQQARCPDSLPSLKASTRSGRRRAQRCRCHRRGWRQRGVRPRRPCCR